MRLDNVLECQSQYSGSIPTKVYLLMQGAIKRKAPQREYGLCQPQRISRPRVKGVEKDAAGEKGYQGYGG